MPNRDIIAAVVVGVVFSAIALVAVGMLVLRRKRAGRRHIIPRPQGN